MKVKIRKDGKPDGYNGRYSDPQYLKKLSEVKKGVLNPNYNGGNSRNYKEYSNISKSLVQKCSYCGNTNKLIVHHIDLNYKNNDINNITIVCRSCHNKIHKTKAI
jgi:5-methylcytosine-specific restriction endonuclease McrA